jgi:hypothetical protein
MTNSTLNTSTIFVMPMARSVTDASGLEEAHQVIHGVMAIGTAVSLTNARI